MKENNPRSESPIPPPISGSALESGVSPGELPRRRSKDVMASSLDIVEEFIGVKLSDDGELVRAVMALPGEQFFELFTRLTSYNSTRTALQRGKPAPDYIEECTALPSSDEIQQYIGRPMHVHEASLAAARESTDIANISALKHLILYCDTIFMENPLENLIAPQEIADALRQLQPIAPLVRSGNVVLARSLGATSSYANQRSDSFIAYLLKRDHPELLQAYEKAWRDCINHVRDNRTSPEGKPVQSRWQAIVEETEAALVQSYPRKVSMDEMRWIKHVQAVAQRYGWTPVTSSETMTYHIEQCVRLKLDGKPASLEPSSSPVGPAVSYGLPSLSEVSFADIIRLRENEPIFAEVRNALGQLATACAQEGQPSDYRSYKNTIHTHAEEIVRPAYEQLMKMQRRAQLRKLAGMGIGKAVGLGLHAAEKTGFAPGAGKAAGAAGSGTQKLVSGNAQRNHQDAEVGLDILKSIMLY